MNSKMKVLVADQEINHRIKLVDLISSLGHLVIETVDSRTVIKECQHKCPDLILLDTSLSGVLAVDLVKQIRRLGGNASWNPIVILGEKITDAEKLALLEAGADDIVQKPTLDLDIKFKLNMANRQAELKADVFALAHDLVRVNRALESNLRAPDILTGVIDMNSFYIELEKLWFIAKKSKHNLSLLLLDLDNFREFNNLYTVEHGDAIIKLVVNNLKQRIANLNNANLARTSGVTFAILLPNVNKDKAVKIAEELRSSVQELKIPHEKSANGKYLTASVGVSTTEEASLKNPQDLLEAADFALYQAKHKGRNQSFFETVNIC